MLLSFRRLSEDLQVQWIVLLLNITISLIRLLSLFQNFATSFLIHYISAEKSLGPRISIDKASILILAVLLGANKDTVGDGIK